MTRAGADSAGEGDAASRDEASIDPGVAWMLEFQRGDELAFDRIVAEYENLVFAVLRRLLGASGWVEELAQETFLRLYRSRDRYEPGGKLSTFLYRISYNLALNRIRDEKRRPATRLPTSEEGETIAFEDQRSAGPEDEAGSEDWATLVQRGLAELPENQRAALVFQHYDGLDLHEIAAIQGISPQAVKSLLHRARENLRVHLQPYRDAEQG